MQARFIGNQSDRTDKCDTVTFQGVTFPLDEWRDLPDEAAAVLKNNPTFELRGEAAKAMPAVPKTESADWHDLDKPGLLAFAEKLKIKLDKRASLPNLQADFAQALLVPPEPESEPEIGTE